MKPILTSHILEDLYGWLADCAVDGRACPGNGDIATRYRFSSVATAAKAVGRLEKQGRIAVLRGWTARQATIVATGLSTAPIRQVDRTSRKPSPHSQRRTTILAGPGMAGPKGRQCQWIEGEPSGDESCKCLRETVPGDSWCPAHRERVYLPPEVAGECVGAVSGRPSGAASWRVAI